VRLFDIVLLAVFTVACFGESPRTVDSPEATIRGKLIQHENQPPAIETSDHKLITLEGDGSTVHVLHDKRLAGLDLEAKGRFSSPDHFQVDPFFTHALHAVKDGKRFQITYWCDVCSIRQYEPGPCWCCQRETALAFKPEDE
jgi:hypothetical protein